MLSVTAKTQISFETISLSPESYDNGSGGGGDFTIGDLTLSNYYDVGWGVWNGFAISNITDNTTPGYMNQYSAYTGSGNNGSDNYAIHFPAGTLAVDWDGFVEGFYITNTSYAAISMRDGDAYSKQFGSPNDANGNPDGTNGEDFFRVWIIGENSTGTAKDSLEFYLADYRFSNDSLDYIVDTWEYVDLTSLAIAATTVSFRFESSDVGAWGINTPTYFAIDDVAYALPVGIQENTALSFDLYPVPMKDELHVNGISSGRLKIYAASGELVLSTNVNDGSAINTSDLPSGVYLVEVESAEGREIRKVVK